MNYVCLYVLGCSKYVQLALHCGCLSNIGTSLSQYVTRTKVPKANPLVIFLFQHIITKSIYYDVPFHIEPASVNV